MRHILLFEFTGSHLPHILQQKAEHGLVIVCVVRQDRMAVYQVAKVHLQDVYKRQGIGIPARRAMKVQPAEAVHDE